MPGGTEGEKGMKDYEKLSREHFDEMADNYAATDGLYYTLLPRPLAMRRRIVRGETGCAPTAETLRKKSRGSLGI